MNESLGQTEVIARVFKLKTGLKACQKTKRNFFHFFCTIQLFNETGTITEACKVVSYSHNYIRLPHVTFFVGIQTVSTLCFFIQSKNA